ncbi:S-layer homology domain-containing protein [Bacillus cereus group sp. Bc253]|uniref:S-layer homology domain-containing protein n=1 Tax=Bacillus cereus group sp. Bc253 TaxID=3018103 RepID=UPI0022E3F9C3|nr:S-layer homology domain-containing protein [Bacillus cereus group sp. Bc253]MDA2157732.1 S-layer homology domain-containing protein [Bacillus cereus group sp. Bc253]
MNKIKQLFLSSIVCVLLFSTVGTAYAEQNSQGDSLSFIDVPKTHWAYKEMMYMAENRIITGYGNGYFGATDPIIREHLAAFLYRYLKPQDSTNNPFVDIDDSNFKKEILALTARGIFTVNVEKQFNPKNNMTRAEMATVLVRTFNLKPQGNFEFTDMKGHWANEYVKILAGNKITNGTGDGNFNPNGIVTREQFSMFLYRTIMATTGKKNNDAVGWVVDGEKKYYYDKPGVKHTGLLRSGDDTYLFDKNGNLASGWNTVDGKDYYFDKVSGAAQKGWFSQTTHWYYADDNGVIQKGGVTYKGKQFQFDRTGKMVKGWITIHSLDQNIYKSRTVARGFDPIKVRNDEILEVVGEDGPLWFKVNYNGKTYVVQKLFAVVFDQSLSNKVDAIRHDIDDLKTSAELVKKYSERYKKAKETKNDDAVIVESSEIAQSISELLTTLKQSDLKNTVDKIYEKEADPAVREKYNSTIATLEMMNEDFGKIHKLMLLKDSIMVLDKANQDSGNIIQQIQNGKNLAQQDKIKLQNYANGIPEYKKQMVEWYADTMEAVAQCVIIFVNEITFFWPVFEEMYVEPAEKWVGSLPQGEISKFADGVRDYGQQLTAMQEGFKSRLPEYKQMADDLRVVNKSFIKFGDSVQKAGASLHKQAVMADGLINSVSTHVAEAQQAFPTIHTDIMSGLNAANNMMDSANKIASYKIDVPAASKNIGNMDGLRNTLRDFGVPPEKMKEYLEEEKRSAQQTSFMLDITPGFGELKQGIQLFTGEDMFTHEKYGPSEFVTGTLAAVTGGTTKIIGRTFGTLGDLEKNAQKLGNVTKNVSKGSFDVAAFDKKIAKMNINEKAAEIKIASKGIAKQNGWEKNSKLSKLNKRDVYVDSKTKNLYAVDTQHGRFEVLNKKGKHQGEVDFNLNSTKPADKSGGHDLIMG